MITPTRPNNSGWQRVSKKSIAGIGGVIGGLISEPRLAADDLQRSQREVTASPARPHARTGRPPGRAASTSAQREKLTVRIDADLLEQYRDWSWEARCNLGELVSQAMRQYLGKRS